MGKQIGSANIFRDHYGDCSNGGISSKYDSVKIWSEFDENAPENAVVLNSLEFGGKKWFHFVPANKGKKHYMFGGCLLYSCNSLDGFDFPVKLHDRYEG